ncbi:MAG: DNA repair protein RecN [Alphaproteobacteria bacterium]|nr:DNA repair protein RecN [Alphaproteobacteria bacterium]
MSLKRIGLKDFVIVQTLDLDLSAGFTVLTGETGAGKSILIDALQLALGERADAGSVREGAQRAEVSAEFDLTTATHAWLEEAGFESQDDVLLLRRTLDRQGKSRAWINGSAATASQLRELGDVLLDIHGQHAWQSLTRPASVLGLLDAYAGAHSTELGQRWQAWREAQRKLSEAQSSQEVLTRERERLSWQLGEIEKLSPKAQEWDDLQTQQQRLSHMQSLIEATEGASQALSDDDSGALAALHRAMQALQDQMAHEPEFEAMVQVLQSCIAQAEDVAHSAQSWLRHADLDPQRLAELDERMCLWMSLARRFRREPDELPAVWTQWQQELATLDEATDLNGLKTRCEQAEQAYRQEALRLRQLRHKAAPKLSATVTAAMQGLGLAGGVFEVQIQDLPQAQSSGLDEVIFLVAGHPGATPKPLGKVASGGELSRIALAIAVTTSQLGQASTLIFDEVDSGVGGAVAETVGRLLKQLGTDRQVLAVTHLPQVAACADQHLVVSKSVIEGHTLSSVHPVAGEQRVREIARMLGGERLSDTTLAHAKEMLGTAPASKKKARG